MAAVGPPIIEVVPSILAGERLDRFVATMLDCSRSVASALVDEGCVEIGGKVATARSLRVSDGMTISVSYAPETEEATTEADPDVAFEVVYEDDDLAVIDKPNGLVVHPGAGTPDGTLANGLVARYPEIASVGDPDRPGIVHRLDRGTTGLMVIARTPEAYVGLVDALAARTVTRTYRAVVWGLPENDRGVIDAAIGRSQRKRTRMTVTNDGRDARTHYEVLARRTDDPLVAFVECRLETGRTHQIRVHMEAIGHPIVGDDVYGRPRATLHFERPALHAAFLAFTHPTTEAPCAFEAALPSDMAQLVDELFDDGDGNGDQEGDTDRAPPQI